MRHGKKFNHLGRKAAHRKAMLANMACSLIEYKRIKTTLAKAKALRLYVEPLITKSKNDTTHSRRMVFSYLKQKEVVTELFGDVASKVAERPGGYTRILKLGNRLGDNAQMAFIELVDYNETYTTDKPTKKKTRRRSSSKIIESVAEEITEEVKEESPAEEVKEESPAEEVKEESPAEEVKEEAPAEEVKEESPAEEVKEESPAEEVKEEINENDSEDLSEENKAE